MLVIDRHGTALLLVLALGTAPASAPAQDESTMTEAKELFSEGVDQFKDGKHAQALESFKKSFELRPHWRLHLNIGLCFMELSMYAEARAEFDAFLAEGKDEIDDAQLEMVESAIKELDAITALLEIEILTEGASVELDGRDVVEEALAGPVQVDPGAHVIKASLVGYEPYSREILVSKGERKQIAITLEPLEKDKPAKAKKKKKKKPEKKKKGSAAFWVMGGLTLALAGGAVATGVLSLGKHDEVESLDRETRDLYDAGGYSDAVHQDYLDERRPIFDTGKSLGYATTGLMVAASAALVGTIVAGVVTRPFSKPEKLSLHLSPVFLPGGGMAVVGGSF